jgi:malate dehydrogenase (oxaloacetate-decarboxylating)(NADP+)
LESANITYKLLKELNKVDSYRTYNVRNGKTVHIFSIRCKCEEMVNMAAIAVIDAQEKGKKKTNLI